MPTKISGSAARSVSTNVDIQFLFSTFLDESNNPSYGPWVDPLTIRAESLLKLKNGAQPYPYGTTSKITTVSQETYGTTSLWAIILYVNGFQHPDDIPPGTVMFLPRKEAIESLLAENNLTESNYGKSFTV